MIELEWDHAKAESNLKKHGVSFEVARSVFYDDLAVQFLDESLGKETRFILLGRSNLSRVLVVVHCERGENDEILRIISARKATKTERNFYRGDQA
jgi:uncharacterized DUF497 family protein